MGCLQSKKDCGDIHPNVFRVLNIDEAGNDLWSGQLEVTETDLILYREGRDATVWPLACLRRYGFDGEIFSFESGRRCVTGEGIYAFRCRRAGILFRTLQQNIQLRNVIHDSLPFQIPPNIAGGSPTAVPRQTLQASVVHRSSVDSGLPARNANLSNQLPRQNMASNNLNQPSQSPSNADILEVMPLYPRPQNTSNQVTNVYQVKNFKAKENNNNQGEQSTDTRHLYSNDITKDLALLRNTLHQETVLSMIRDREDELLMSGHCDNAASSNAPVSPTLSSSEQYAQLCLDQEQAGRLYMNIVPSEIPHMDSKPNTPLTPLTPKQPEYCNLNLVANSYANLSLGDMADSINTAKQLMNSGAEFTQKCSESDTFTSMSPIEELEVNYAVLDIDVNKDVVKTPAKELTSPLHHSCNNSRQESTGSHSSSLVQVKVSQGSDTTVAACSPTTPTNVGYTTIDFDKTVALTSVVSGTDVDSDGYRKTRHNSTTANCSSPH